MGRSVGVQNVIIVMALFFSGILVLLTKQNFHQVCSAFISEYHLQCQYTEI